MKKLTIKKVALSLAVSIFLCIGVLSTTGTTASASAKPSVKYTKKIVVFCVGDGNRCRIQKQ